jgi:SAM-dependent methyltransferase
MDDPKLPLPETERALRELGRVHRWVGNGGLWRQLLPVLARGPRGQRLLDVGTGDGQVAAAARRRAATRGVALRVVGLDRKLTHLTIGRRHGFDQLRVVGDALALPFRDGAVDVAISSFFQHHFDRTAGRKVLDEMRRVAGRAAIVVDIRRSRLGGALGRLVLTLLRMGPVTAHDGRVSLDQGWTLADVRACAPAGAVVALRRRWPFRWALELAPGGEAADTSHSRDARPVEPR